MRLQLERNDKQETGDVDEGLTACERHARSDCGDSSDETDCPEAATFACADGEVQPADCECDAVTDCADGSDELNCAEPATLICSSRLGPDGRGLTMRRGGVSLPPVIARGVTHAIGLEHFARIRREF